MHVEIVLAALVTVVAVLVAADFFRRTSDAPHEYPAGNEQGPAALHSPSPPYEHAPPPPPASARQDGARRDGARREYDAGTPGPSPDPGGPRTNWLVRTRLCLLAVVSAAAA